MRVMIGAGRKTYDASCPASSSGIRPDGPVVMAPFWRSKLEELPSRPEIKSCSGYTDIMLECHSRLWEWW
ncbi:hypothetical protein EVAR_81371_1 [Eumeta japonica]|uniref:Uncharacterized protein n=1 Tax=Eumeta variegata TaxID=151549 RepID=A0A4C1WGW5_EUMVA|nr:hypothetical protein EVAR_81371_1 [Eumeta japonica]